SGTTLARTFSELLRIRYELLRVLPRICSARSTMLDEAEVTAPGPTHPRSREQPMAGLNHGPISLWFQTPGPTAQVGTAVSNRCCPMGRMSSQPRYRGKPRSGISSRAWGRNPQCARPFALARRISEYD